jgi:hypothetical protein
MRPQMLVPALVIVHVVAALTQPTARAAPSGDDQKIVAAVAARIFAEAAPVEGWAWPPLVAISDKDEVNAFATLCQVTPGETPTVQGEGNLTWVTVAELTPAAGDDALSGADAGAGGVQAKPGGDGTILQPIIVLNQGLLDRVVKGSLDRLAAVLGHEMAHILLRHVDNVPPGAPMAASTITRQQESAADMLGMKLGLAAGFPYRALLGGMLAMRGQGNSNSFEGVNDAHPTWTDRVAMIDDQQRELWPSISAFENGMFFLMTEQYQLAESCFLQVVKDCPRCYEAHANLGYACLMQYCDALEPENLRDLDVGQLVVGGFFRRPDLMEGATRGLTPDVIRHWWDAVGSLRQALILNPDLVLPKASLAVAYLIGPPDGRDIGRAEELFSQVRSALKSGATEDMDPLVRASLLINSGVAQMAVGDMATAEELFAQAEGLFGAVDSAGAAGSALHYNRGWMYAVASAGPTQRATAIEELETYLSSSSSAANWWTLAYEQYVKLCHDQGVEPKDMSELSLAANAQHRLVTGIALADGTTISLNDSVAALVRMLGEGRRQDIVPMSNVRRIQYWDQGIEVLCTEHIVAIRLRGPKAPGVVIRASGPGGEAHEVRPGMTVAELDALMDGDATAWDQRYGTNTQIIYRFYTRLGFGVRIVDGKILEIIVARIPVEAKV